MDKVPAFLHLAALIAVCCRSLRRSDSFIPVLRSSQACAVFLSFFEILCWNSLPLMSDFRRIGLEHLKVLTGILKVLGSVGLLVGIRW